MRKGILVGLAALLAVSAFAHAGTIAPPAGGTAIMSDDFESYADTAALKAVWNANAAGVQQLAVGGGKGGGNGVMDTGSASTAVLARTIPTYTLSDANPIVIEADQWDYSGTTGVRSGINIRGGSTYFDVAIYNAQDDGNGGAVGNGYAFRNNGTGYPSGTKGYWWSLSPTRVTSTDPAVAYHHLKMVIGQSSSTYSYRLADGTTFSKTTAHTATAIGKTLTTVRIGVGASSTGVTLYDNLQVYTIPEPASMLLLGLGGLLLRRRRA